MSSSEANMPPSIPSSMRAIALSQFAKPANYNVASLPVPAISKPNELLIKVHAASINPVDVKMASPQIGAIMDSKATFPYKLGHDVSGVIAATGSEPGSFKVGDEVFARIPGEYRGTLAEYVTTPTTHVALKPKTLSHVDAASIPLAAQTAFQALREADRILPGGLKGKTVFVPAGLSGTGSFGVQIAKNYFKAGKVITTLSPGKILMAKELLPEGVIDQVVDYTKGIQHVIEQIGVQAVDFLFDTTGQTVSLAPTLKRGGVILSIATIPDGNTMKLLQPSMAWWLAYILSIANWGMTKYVETRWGVHYSYFLLRANGKDLAVLGDMTTRGELKAIVGDVAGLEDIEGVRKGCGKVLEGKGGVGKFVIEVVKA